MLRTGLFLSYSTTLAATLLLLSPTARAQTRAPAENAYPATAVPVAPSATPSAPADECIPSCRSSYICAHGQCVSACNPPCTANEVCTTTGQCVATGPAPAAVAPPAPVVAPAPGPVSSQAQGPQSQAVTANAGNAAGTNAPNMADLAPEPPPVEKSQFEIKTFSFVPRLGLQATGSMTEEYKCDGASCPSTTATNYDYDLKSAFAIGADFMFKVHDLVRIGPGLLHTFASDATIANSPKFELGTITEINLVAELIPRVSPVVWLVPRLQLGATVFNASGTFKTAIATAKAGCAADQTTYSSDGATVSCSNYDNPHVGFNLGIGFGALFAIAPSIRLRADALYEYFSFPIGNEEGSGNGYDFKLTDTLSGSRFLLMAGVEI